MRITLVTHYYPPEVNAPAQRAFEHARVWTEAGCEVTILTAQPSHPFGRVYEGYYNHASEETVRGTRIVRLKTTLGPNIGRIRRSINYTSFFQAVHAKVRKAWKADVVVSTSPQFLCGLAGQAVARAAHAPWVLEIRDIWPESILAVGAVKSSLATVVLSGLADRAYRQCDRIVSVSPGFAKHFRERGVPDTKVALIPNGVDVSAKPCIATFDDFPGLSVLKGRRIAAYVGTLGMAHDVGTILDAAARLRSDQRIGFLLVGAGAEQQNLVARRSRLGLDNVVILDQMPRRDIERLFGLIDIGIVHLKKQDIFKTVIPTKLLESMAMGKPVVLGVEGVAKNILEAAGGGRSFEPENAEALAKTVRELVGDPVAAAEMGAAGRTYVCKHFDRRALALKYLDILRDARAQWASQ